MFFYLPTMRATLPLQSWAWKAYKREMERLNEIKRLRHEKVTISEQLFDLGYAGFSTKTSRENIIHYLIGNNTSLYGTVLAFRKSWKKNNPSAPYYSFFVYYSHETGRIERFLYNEGSKDLDKPTLKLEDFESYNPITDTGLNFNDKDLSTEYIENYKQTVQEKYPNILFNFQLLNDGKLNKQFYDLFILELMRDYFFTELSFGLCDMRVLRHFTTPIVDSVTQSDYKDRLGCGKINKKAFNKIINEYSTDNKNNKELIEKITKNLEYCLCFFRAPKFIRFFKDKDSIINVNVPENFQHKFSNTIVNHSNLNLISVPNENLPKSILDLKSFINTRKISNRDDLRRRVIDFNKRSYKKLLNIYSCGYYNNQDHYPKLRKFAIINEHFSINMPKVTTSKNFIIEDYTSPDALTNNDDSLNQENLKKIVKKLK
uniref:Uncharacterized protein n=1 Tax=Coniophora puteana TaxID=80637 RepID=A0A896Z1S0_9AGAM